MAADSMIVPARGWLAHVVEAGDVLVVCEELCGALLQQSILIFFPHPELSSASSTLTSYSFSELPDARNICTTSGETMRIDAADC